MAALELPFSLFCDHDSNIQVKGRATKSTHQSAYVLFLGKFLDIKETNLMQGDATFAFEVALHKKIVSKVDGLNNASSTTYATSSHCNHLVRTKHTDILNYLELKAEKLKEKKQKEDEVADMMLATYFDFDKYEAEGGTSSVNQLNDGKRSAEDGVESQNCVSKRQAIDAHMFYHAALSNLGENSEASLSDIELGHLKTHDVGNLKALSEFPLRENNAAIFTVLMDQLVILDVRNKGEFSGLFSGGASTCSLLTAHTVDQSGKVTQIALGHITANELPPHATEKSISISESFINLLVRNQPEGVHHISIIGGESDLAEELHEQVMAVQKNYGERVKLSFVDANVDESRNDNVAICSAKTHCYYENSEESPSSELDDLEKVLSLEQLDSYAEINESNNKTKVYFARGNDLFRISFNDKLDSNFSFAKVKHLGHAIIE